MVLSLPKCAVINTSLTFGSVHYCMVALQISIIIVQIVSKEYFSEIAHKPDCSNEMCMLSKSCNIDLIGCADNKYTYYII